jgi:hypothetical protein
VLHRLRYLPPQNPQKSLRDWAEEQYTLYHSAKTNGRKIAKALRAALPDHLVSQAAQLGAVVQEILKEAALARPSGVNNSDATPTAANAVSETVVEPPAACFATAKMSEPAQQAVSSQLATELAVESPDRSSPRSRTHLDLNELLQSAFDRRIAVGDMPVGNFASEEVQVPPPGPAVRRNAKVVGMYKQLPFHVTVGPRS